MVVYNVHAYRWGRFENHNYPVGTFSKRSMAIAAAERHTTYRGGKYAVVVRECEVDKPKDDEFEESGETLDKIVYRTYSLLETAGLGSDEDPRLKIGR